MRHYSARLAVAVACAFSTHHGLAQSSGSSINIYGIVDAGIIAEKGGANGRLTKMTSGIGAGSRLGFRGTEDLGGGMSAFFTLENGFTTDTGGAAQGGLLFGRQALVGIRGGAGGMSLGRQYTPQFLVLNWIDPFATTLTGTVTNIMATTGTRMNNAVKYASPAAGPVSGEIAYGLGEVAGNAKASSQIGASLRYLNGPLEVRLAGHQAKNPTDTLSIRHWLAGIAYEFPYLTIHVAHGANKGSATTASANIDQTDSLIGLTVPIGVPGKLLFSHILKNDRMQADRDATQTSIGYFYALSKRTALYASYTRTVNKNGATYKASTATEAGSGDRALAFGLNHRF